MGVCRSVLKTLLRGESKKVLLAGYPISDPISISQSCLLGTDFRLRNAPLQSVFITLSSPLTSHSGLFSLKINVPWSMSK